MGAHPVEQPREPRVARMRGDWLRHVLGLSALAVRRDHEAARDPVRGVRAEAPPHDVQAAVEACRRAGRRHQVAVVHVQHVGIEFHARKAPGEIVGPRPVRGGRAALEQAGRGEHVGAEAQADELRAARGDRADRIEQRVGRHFVRAPPGRHDDDVCIVERIEPVRCGDREATRRRERAALGRADAELECGRRGRVAFLAEHDRRHRQMERADAVVRDHGDDGRYGRGGWGGWRERGGGEHDGLRQGDGPILSKNGYRATIGTSRPARQCIASHCWPPRSGAGQRLPTRSPPCRPPFRIPLPVLLPAVH